jgi:hypothetical protein
VHRLGKFGEASLRNTDFASRRQRRHGRGAVGEFASRLPWKKSPTSCSRVLPAVGHRTGRRFFRRADGAVRRRSTARCSIVGSSYEGNATAMETTLSLLLVPPGPGRIRAHRRQPHLLPATAREPPYPAAQPGRHPCRLAGRATALYQRSGRPAPIPAATRSRRPWAAATSMSRPRVGAVAYEPGDVFLLNADGLTEGLYDPRPAGPATAGADRNRRSAPYPAQDQSCTSSRRARTAGTTPRLWWSTSARASAEMM